MNDPFRRFVPLDYLAAAAILSIAAGAIHARVIFDHLREGILVAGFFAVAAALQAWWSLLIIRRPTRQLLVGGALISTLLIATWLISRTAGVPIGPEAGEREAVGEVDLMASLYEMGIIAAIVRSWPGPLPNTIEPRSLHPSLFFLVAPVATSTLYAIVVGHPEQVAP